MQPLSISVILCTRNRASSLGRALESVNRLAAPKGAEWELVIVDNGSTDGTRETAEQFIANCRIKARYCFEEHPGTSCARNRGMQIAGGDYFAFTDDDMVLDRNWLVRIAEWARNGPGELLFGQTRPARADMAKLALRAGDDPQCFVFPCNPAEAGSSNNMIVRRATAAAIGGFDTTLGPGTLCRAAEDLDFTYRVLRSGKRVDYRPEVIAYHDHRRLSASSVLATLMSYGKGRGSFYCKHILRGDLWAAKLLYWEALDCMRRLRDRTRRVPVLAHLVGMASGVFIRVGVDCFRAIKARPALHH